MNEAVNINVSATEVRCLFAVSIVFSLFGLYYFFFHNKCFKSRKYSFENRITVLSITLIIATWCMRFLVGISGLLYSQEEANLTRFEEVFNSLVHMLQSFSMDEVYTEYLVKGKVLMSLVFPDCVSMTEIYSVYVSLLNVVCPIVGGAILFAILTSIFPKIKIFFMTFMFWRPICYFSDLNENSLALAKSIRDADKFLKKTIIIFSDVYTDNKNEVASERIQKAKYLNAICIKDDLSDLPISRRHGKKIFLIDQNEQGNLQALAEFKNKKRYKRLNHRDEIYIFGTDETNQLAVNSINSFFKKHLKEQQIPFIMTVNGMRNLVYNLLKEKPLFLAKTNSCDEEDKNLTITIFGSGQIGTEMFLASYWCGQLLGYDLRITVVSKEKKSNFISRINHINTDIFKSGEDGNELLRIYKTDDRPFAKKYFSFDYVETDIRHDDLYTKMLQNGENGRIVDSDYVVVSLGTDEDNLDIADKIGRFISLAKICNKPKNKIPIAYVIYNDALNELLKNSCDHSNLFVDMFPFGSLGDTYSFDKIVFEEIKNSAKAIGDSYQKTINSKTTSDRAIETYHRDAYSYWADITRAIHIQYKAFCAGKTVEEYEKEARDENSELNKNQGLAWLEHRRWNAFLRTNGFKTPTEEEEKGYIDLLPDIVDKNDKTNKGKHKNIELKLHPCLVECACGTQEDAADQHEKDLLDAATDRFKKDYQSKKFPINDFKIYDYPRGDFD